MLVTGRGEGPIKGKKSPSFIKKKIPRWLIVHLLAWSIFRPPGVILVEPEAIVKINGLVNRQ